MRHSFSILVGDNFSYGIYKCTCDLMCKFCRLKFVCATNRLETYSNSEDKYMRLPEGSEASILSDNTSDVEVVRTGGVNQWEE